MNILIADSGSTKTEWVLLTGNTEATRIRTVGLNPYFTDQQKMIDVMTGEVLPAIHALSIDRLYFYGAGCKSPRNAEQVALALINAFGETVIEVNHDLMGAARALFGSSPGIACILGTGSNSCCYDGKEIARQVPSLGYVLGDEGSGACLGKKLVTAWLRDELPVELVHKFEAQQRYSMEKVLDHLYRRPNPNLFLGSFVPFVAENQSHPYLNRMVRESFTDFFRYYVNPYKDYRSHPVSFIGSVAVVFSEILESVAVESGKPACKILNSPMEGLVKFHTGLPGNF